MKTKEKYVSKQLAQLGYRCVAQCRDDLVATLRLYRSLAPSAETYVFETGEMAQLLNLGGTIPILYRDQNYNIPIKIWLTQDYPEAPPFFYVIPTKDMELSVSPYVDHSGLVELPCLAEWNPGVTDLCTLLQIARVTFCETPPVFAKPRQVHRKVSKDEFESVWDEHFPDEDEKMLKSFFLTSASEECRTKLGEEYSRTRAEVDSLHSVNKELIEHQEGLEQARREMAAREEEVATDLETLAEARAVLEVVGEARSVTAPVTADTVDELVRVPAPGHRQLLEAVANDEAIKDCVYALGQALRRDRVSVEVYLKKVRELSRDQFTCRLLINTIQGKMEREQAGPRLPRQQSLP
jgi:ESCRT-I complex subunit TSG101